MRRLRELKNTLRSFFRMKQAEQDLEDELRDHLEAETESNIRAGMNPEEARFAAQRLMGQAALFKDECRDERGIGFVETTIRDMRYAFRMLRRTPVFASIAVLTLAIGIGANTTVFTFVDNVLLRHPPVHDPEKVVVLNWGVTNFSYPNYLDFRDRNDSFSQLVAYRYVPANMSVAERGNFRAWGYEASGNYFQTLGVQPELGRFFGPKDDDQPGAHPVVVIGYRLWQSRFGGDPAAIGKVMKINGFPFTIIGVAGKQFPGTELIVDGEYWVPFCMLKELEAGSDWIHNRVSQNAWILGRMKPGVSRLQAEGNLDQIGAQIAREDPNEVSNQHRFHLSEPGLVGDGLRQPITAIGIVLMSVAGLGLLLACVNLAGMLLARASDRRREVGVRLAIGASRGQLIRQLMTESFLLAAGGTIGGYLMAILACRFLSTWHPTFDIPITIALSPNVRVLCFTIAVAVVTTVVCGLVPASQTVKVDLVPSLKNEPLSIRFRRWNPRDLLVTGQIAISMVLVICSVLMARSLQNAFLLQLGFNPENAVSVSFDLGMNGYDEARIGAFQTKLLEKARELPGIEAAGITSTLPLSTEGENNEFFWPANQALPKPDERKLAMTYNVSSGYIRAAGTKLLAGRDISQFDGPKSQRVALVNETMSRLLFGRESPVGRPFQMFNGQIVVVGVVEDGKYESLGEAPTAAVFLPMSQQVNRWTTLVARTRMPPGNATELLRKAVMGLDSEVTVFNVGSLKDHLALPLFGTQMVAIVLGTFGAFAMLLAAIGLFALMSYAVSRRTREIGIRMALGARRQQVLTSLLGRTLMLCGVGISIGAVATLAAGQFLKAVLFDVSPRDPLSYGLVLMLMIGVAVSACLVPASRAIRIDPLRALRED
jgi:predicted permease